MHHSWTTYRLYLFSGREGRILAMQEFLIVLALAWMSFVIVNYFFAIVKKLAAKKSNGSN